MERRERENWQTRFTHGALGRCFVTHGMVKQAAMISVQGARTLLTQLLTKEHVDYGDLMYPSDRIEEIRRLIRELLRRGDTETARRIAHLNHMLKERLRRIAIRHDLNPGICLREDTEH